MDISGLGGCNSLTFLDLSGCNELGGVTIPGVEVKFESGLWLLIFFRRCEFMVAD